MLAWSQLPTSKAISGNNEEFLYLSNFGFGQLSHFCLAIIFINTIIIIISSWSSIFGVQSELESRVGFLVLVTVGQWNTELRWYVLLKKPKICDWNNNVLKYYLRLSSIPTLSFFPLNYARWQLSPHAPIAPPPVYLLRLHELHFRHRLQTQVGSEILMSLSTLMRVWNLANVSSIVNFIFLYLE